MTIQLMIDRPVAVEAIGDSATVRVIHDHIRNQLAKLRKRKSCMYELLVTQEEMKVIQIALNHYAGELKGLITKLSCELGADAGAVQKLCREAVVTDKLSERLPTARFHMITGGPAA